MMLQILIVNLARVYKQGTRGPEDTILRTFTESSIYYYLYTVNKYYQLGVGKVYWDNSNICSIETFMPSKRRQKAKARKSRELDMMSDIDNLDIMLGNSGENPKERELAEAIEQSSVQGDIEANEYRGNNYSFTQENEPIRQSEVRQSFETFTNEFNLRLSQEMDSMMSMVHNQINRAISTAISERVIPEIQNIVSSMSSSGNRDTEASMSPSSQENRENSSSLKTKILKKDSRSVGDLRDTAGGGHYTQYCIVLKS